MRVITVGTALLALLLVAPAFAEPASFQHRVVERRIATPTPLGPLQLFSDQTVFVVDVPHGAVVQVVASANATSPFHFRFHEAGTPEPGVTLPATYQGALLGEGAWRVLVDPAAGARTRVDVTFAGFYGDVGGAAAPFGLSQSGPDPACILPGACLL